MELEEDDISSTTLVGDISATTSFKIVDDKDIDSEKYRMWAAISFAFMLLIVGIPLWWKTTEVQRASLPYDEIHNLDPSAIKIGMSIYLYCEYPSRINSIVRLFDDIFSGKVIYSIRFEAFKISMDKVTYEDVENDPTINIINPGDLLLIEVSSLPKNKIIFISNKRIIYFTKESSNEFLVTTVKDWFLREEDLQNKVTSIVSPQILTGRAEILDSLRASLSYDVVFTVINSDPELINLVWDVSSDIKYYIQPLLDQLTLISNHFVKSQWLYFVDLGEAPKSDSSGWHLSFSQLPHIITPLEKKLGSGISKNPCVHLILYVVSCKFAPLSFLSFTGDRVSSMISPQWGAVQILNPSLENCSNFSSLTPDSKEVMGTFTSQLHSLLGVRNKKVSPHSDIGLMNISGSSLRDWEVDNLYRIRTVEQITSASLTLQSLSKLLGEISNIVINEDVANSISDAVVSLHKATKALEESNLVEALTYSQTAYSSSETAFSDPSLLALLYFPDDQKYAVYIPLFLPIMIPVLMSLKKIQTWLVYGTTFTEEKLD